MPRRAMAPISDDDEPVVSSSVSSVGPVGVDAEELRRRIEGHLQQHAEAGEMAGIAVEEVVVDASGRVRVSDEVVTVTPRRRGAQLAGELVLGYPFEWYVRLAWLPALTLAAFKVATLLASGRQAAAVEASSWTVPALAAAGIWVALLGQRRGATVGQAAVAGATAGAVAGATVALFRLFWTWRLVAIFNLIVEPAYYVCAGALVAAVAAVLVRRVARRR